DPPTVGVVDQYGNVVSFGQNFPGSFPPITVSLAYTGLPAGENGAFFTFTANQNPSPGVSQVTVTPQTTLSGSTPLIGQAIFGNPQSSGLFILKASQSGKPYQIVASAMIGG